MQRIQGLDLKCTPGADNPTLTPDVFGLKKFRAECVRNCITSRLRFDIRVLEGFTGRCSQDPFIFYRRTFIFAALWSVLLAYDKSSHQEVRPWKHLRR